MDETGQARNAAEAVVRFRMMYEEQMRKGRTDEERKAMDGCIFECVDGCFRGGMHIAYGKHELADIDVLLTERRGDTSFIWTFKLMDVKALANVVRALAEEAAILLGSK